MDVALIRLASVFTTTVAEGLVVGVVLESQHISDGGKTAIARKVSFETIAFRENAGDVAISARFFDADGEKIKCTEGLLALGVILRHQNLLQIGKHVIATQKGKISIDIASNGIIWISLRPPSLMEEIDSVLIAEALRVSLLSLVVSVPARVVSIGGKRIICVYLRHRSTLHRCDPNTDLLSQMMVQHDCSELLGYTLDTIGGSKVHCRTFSSLSISEPNASPDAWTAVVALALKHDDLHRIFFPTFFVSMQISEWAALLEWTSETSVGSSFEQGLFLGVFRPRPCFGFVKLELSAERSILETWVGGLGASSGDTMTVSGVMKKPVLWKDIAKPVPEKPPHAVEEDIFLPPEMFGLAGQGQPPMQTETETGDEKPDETDEKKTDKEESEESKAMIE